MCVLARSMSARSRADRRVALVRANAGLGIAARVLAFVHTTNTGPETGHGSMKGCS